VLEVDTGAWSAAEPVPGDPATYGEALWMGDRMVFLPNPSPAIPGADMNPPARLLDPDTGAWEQTSAPLTHVDAAIAANDSVIALNTSDDGPTADGHLFSFVMPPPH
jgi:hypothetical protein